MAEPSPGLTVQDGQFYKDGHPDKAVGVNYMTAFMRKLGLEGTPTERSARDKMYRQNIYVVYQAFAETVRAIDPDSLVFSGDAMPRPGGHHTFHHGRGETDTLEQWEETFLLDNTVMDGLSAHFYYFSSDDKHHDIGDMEYGPEKQRPFMMEVSRRANKPLFIG